jgi:hypothetical protein
LNIEDSFWTGNTDMFLPKGHVWGVYNSISPLTSTKPKSTFDSSLLLLLGFAPDQHATEVDVDSSFLLLLGFAPDQHATEVDVDSSLLCQSLDGLS